jgi:RecB family exonuclease
MSITTSTTRNKPKPFSWSYSKLKNYRTCPKRHYHVDVARDVKEEESEALSYGNTVHKVLAQYVEHGTILPPVLAPTLKPWGDKVRAGSHDKLLVEQKLAIRADFSGCDWFAPDAWYRGIADVIKIKGPVALVIDYKTGKVLEDGIQLALMAACVFAHHPEVQKIRTEFFWIKEDASTRADFTRADLVAVWNTLLPEVKQLEEAHRTSTFPPTPSGLCRKWCPVSSCPHFGVG